MRYINYKKMIAYMITILIGCFIFCACDAPKKRMNESMSYDETKKDEVYSYIENTYGFAEKTLYGEYKAVTTRDGTSQKADSIMKFKEGSKGGAVFFKQMKKSEKAKDVVCLYLDDTENDKISLKFQEMKEESGKFKYHTMSLAEPHMKSKFYSLIKDKYLICAELAEKNEGWVNGYNYLAYEEKGKNLSQISSNLIYEECVSVYNIDNDMEKVLEIKRTIDPKEQTKVCEIKKGNDIWAYAAGFGSYSYDSATLFEKEQDFCDKANELIHDISVEEFKFTRTSWKNRWYRLEIDESNISKDMVKVDFKTSYGKVENKTVMSDIVITINEESEAHGILADEGDDTPVNYGASDNKQDKSNIKNINGTWVSKDNKYAFKFKCQQGSMGIDYNSGISAASGTFTYVYIVQEREQIQGSFNFADENTIIVTPNLSNGETITFSIEENKLVSDEIALIKVPDELVTQFEGTWQNKNEEIIFSENDDTFKYKGKNKSTWGIYYVLSEEEILLSDKSKDFKVYSYSISSNHIIINKKKYDRISSGADADTLLKFKNMIAGTWETTSSQYEEYRFDNDGTWSRYHVFYSEDKQKLISENYLEGGTYRVLNKGKLVIYYGMDRVQFRELDYNEVLGTLSGGGITLEKK